MLASTLMLLRHKTHFAHLCTQNINIYYRSIAIRDTPCLLSFQIVRLIYHYFAFSFFNVSLTSLSLFVRFSSFIFHPLSSLLSCCSIVLKFLAHQLLVRPAKLSLLFRPSVGLRPGSTAYHQLPSVVFAPAPA